MLEIGLIFIGAFFMVGGFVNFFIKLTKGLFLLLFQLSQGSTPAVGVDVNREVFFIMFGFAIILLRNGI